MQLTFAYPPETSGFWSPATATLNWCEEDYYATFYIAEIINTLTNVFFIYVALNGIRNCRQHHHPVTTQIAFFNMLLVGVGSFLFHMTLNYWTQLLDELSMIYLASTNFYQTFAFNKSETTKKLILLFTVSVSVGGSLYYHFLKDPVFHQVAHTILTCFIVFTNIYRMERLWSPSPSAARTTSKPAKAAQEDTPSNNASVLRSMRAMVFSGISTVLIAFALWSLDQIHCSQLRVWRHALGLPWGIVLEGHGWWHLLTALSAHYMIVWLAWLRYYQEGRQGEMYLDWPSLWTSLPAIKRRKRGVKQHTA